MDLRLLALLLVCVCRGRLTSAEVSEGESIPLVPLIPAMPSHPREPAPTDTVPTLNTTAPDGPERDASEEDDDDGECPSVSRSLESREVIANAIMTMGLQLLQNLNTTSEEPNVIISPLSISIALSQLALGAANETEVLLMHHLHANTLPCYHSSLRSVLRQLRNSDLQVATRIFLRQGFMLKPEFARDSQRLYGSEPATLEGREQVNAWVENATNGKLRDFLSSLPPNVLLVLINAVHFKGAWTSRFDPRFTSRGAFYIDEKRMVDVEMMEDPKHPLSLLIDNDLDAQVARFPFQRRMSLLVVSPLSGRVNVAAIAEKLNISDLYARLPKERAVQVKFPKFKLEYGHELQDVLTKMGLGDIFLNPNLARIADGPLVVSSVMHKSTMEINEEGAEATAATAVVISRASNPIFYLTQPFFLALVDDVTKVPIFVGVVTNPNPGAPILQRGGYVSKDNVVYPLEKNYGLSFGGPPK